MASGNIGEAWFGRNRMRRKHADAVLTRPRCGVYRFDLSLTIDSTLAEDSSARFIDVWRETRGERERTKPRDRTLSLTPLNRCLASPILVVGGLGDSQAHQLPWGRSG